MKVEVDARGLECPKPVIMTKKAIDQMDKGSIVTIVDNDIAKENIIKMAKKMNFDYNVEIVGGNYHISIFKDELLGNDIMGQPKAEIDDVVILVGSDKMGTGMDELGEVLIKGYFYTLTERKPYPKSILFINSGVNLTIESSPVLEHLRVLEAEGVEILSCGTCLDYYNMKNQLAVGGVTNMYTIVDNMGAAKKTIRI